MSLNLPPYKFKVKDIEERRFIFDTIRRKYVKLTPEEWVRQNFVRFLHEERYFPESLISIEHSLKVFGERRRSDIVLFNRDGKPLMVVECKAESIKIDQRVFDQIAMYNSTIGVEFLVVTNGIKHYCCQFCKGSTTYQFIEQIPNYNQLT